VISELMYHPVLDEEGPEEEREFVEVYNRGPASVALAGWQLGGDVRFTFPAGAVIAAGQYVVVAKSRAKLAAVASYGLRQADLMGDYAGQLDNGKKGRVVLANARGELVDQVIYSSEFPWPIGADALGLQPSWLPASLQPASKHRYMGRSLERIDPGAPSELVQNWDASALDGATPGRPNSVAGSPRAIVMAQSAKAAGERARILAGDEVAVQAVFSDGAVSDVQVEYFVDDLTRSDEAVTAVTMTWSEGGWRATLPKGPANSVVRYRISGRRAGGASERVSPRPSDPQEWHAYFVSPEATGGSRAYHLFITPSDWGQLYDNVTPGWVKGCGLGENPTCTSCEVNAAWNATVPAVFVADDRVYDVRVRYQGGKFSRAGGRALKSWTFPAPTSWKQQALGWHVAFPRYQRYEGKKAIRLNKRAQACTGIPDRVVSRVFAAAGLPEWRMRYARLHVNGGYYLYALEQEAQDDAWIGRAFPGQPIGDLYEDNAIRWDQGPWGWGDFRLLQPFCGYSETERYHYTYERKTLHWKDDAEMIALIKGLHAARAAGPEALRAYLAAEFDVDRVLRYLAVINWAGAWDDDYHNFLLYRPVGGKWLLLSSDHNLLLTGVHIDPATNATRYGDAARSFQLGRQDDPDNWRRRWNYLKDAFLVAYQAEYVKVLRQMADTAFAPAAVHKLVDEVAASFDEDDARQSLSSNTSCDGVNNGHTGALAVKAYVTGRAQALAEFLRR
jgi:hypothetical protein